MIDQDVQQQLSADMERLPSGQQRRVLEFASRLAGSRLDGASGKSLLKFAGAIDKADLDLMKAVIEEGCERIDPGEW